LRTVSSSAGELLAQMIRHGLEPYLESTHAYVGLLDEAGGMIASNPALGALTGERQAPISVWELIVPSLRPYADGLIRQAHDNDGIARGILEFGSEKEAVRCEAVIIPMNEGATLLFAEPVSPDADLRWVGSQLEAELLAVKSALASKTVELRAVMAQADELAHTDPLTFLPNRRLIVADLQRQVHYAERYGTPLTISMLDLDRFKSINDNLGHAVGDQVLTEVCRELREHIRLPDEIGRYGGDELLLILPNCGAAAASEQAARLCQRVRALTIDPAAERLTISIGIAQWKAHGEGWEALLERADRALYEAKHLGGDRWIIMET
jgi:diguanylate cyclase (GGDEF)-like protein